MATRQETLCLQTPVSKLMDTHSSLCRAQTPCNWQMDLVFYTNVKWQVDKNFVFVEVQRVGLYEGSLV